MNRAEQFLQKFNEKDLDLSKEYGVVFTDRSISSKKTGIFDQENRKLVYTFDTEIKAKEKADRMNDILSPGEKKHYGMKYTAVKMSDLKLKKS